MLELHSQYILDKSNVLDQKACAMKTLAVLASAQNSIFTDEHAARDALEDERWPNGPVCPHCGNIDQAKIAKIEGKKRTHRPGLYYCNECRGTFTVTVGTVFERSKVPLSKWWLATYMLNSSENGISAQQIHRSLGVTYKTAWFMIRRIREAMRPGRLSPRSGAGRAIENGEACPRKVDNSRAFSQRKDRPNGKVSPGRKDGSRPVVALVGRRVRTFHVGQPGS